MERMKRKKPRSRKDNYIDLVTATRQRCQKIKPGFLMKEDFELVSTLLGGV